MNSRRCSSRLPAFHLRGFQYWISNGNPLRNVSSSYCVRAWIRLESFHLYSVGKQTPSQHAFLFQKGLVQKSEGASELTCFNAHIQFAFWKNWAEIWKIKREKVVFRLAEVEKLRHIGKEKMAFWLMETFFKCAYLDVAVAASASSADKAFLPLTIIGLHSNRKLKN